MKRLIFSLITLTVLLAIMTLTAYASPQSGYQLAEQPIIKVGIWSNQSNVLVSADTRFAITNEKTKEILGTFPGKEKVSITVNNEQIFLNGKPVLATSLKVEPSLTDGNHYVEVNRKQYRGTITLHRTTGKMGLTVVNTLPLEQYLYGIVPDEMPSEWPAEAVKAQAVAARTFALYNLHKHAADGYDVCATVDCQVYGGKSSETEQATKAVDSTYGQVILYNEKPIQAFFHSSSGGFTENSENVWGTAFPYLRAVADYDQKSPASKWEKNLLPADLSAALKREGYNIGEVRAIELSVLQSLPVSDPDRGISGRVKSIRMIGDKGSATLTGTKFRTLFGLKSTLFDIKVIIPLDKSVDVRITDSYGDREMKSIEINLPPRQETGLLNEKQNIRRITGRPGEMIVVTGSGWGHGLGLSQWGAKGMAEKGPAGDPTYFKEILKHYYQSTVIKKVY